MNDNWWEEVVNDMPWAIWCPVDIESWQPFCARLAAKYSAQGCLVRLVGDAAEFDALPIPEGEFPDPDPDAPPFSPYEIVWWERAARYSRETYGAQWERIRAWVEETTGRKAMNVVCEHRRLLGEWGGGYDLEKASQEAWGNAPLFENPQLF